MDKDRKAFYIPLTGVLAALITLFTAFFVHIPIGVNGGYVHFGDTLIYLAASVLPLPYAMAAGAIGGGIADLLTAPMWALPTVIIKALLVLPFTAKHDTILCRRNYVAPWIAYIISALGYYVAEAILFGNWAVFIASVTQQTIQGIGSAVFYYLLAGALDKAHLKTRTLKTAGLSDPAAKSDKARG